MRALLMSFGLLILLCSSGAREVSSATSRSTQAAWSYCEGTLCKRIQDEAEGLARVKLLRGYVVETVRLLDHLMETMDTELIQIAEEMSDFVGPRCQSAHAILSQVVEKLPRSDEAELSAGIMVESRAQKLDEQHDDSREIAGGIETESQRSDDNSWSAPDTWQSSTSQGPWSSSSAQTSQVPGSGRQLYGEDSQSTLPSQQGSGQSGSGWVISNDPWDRESIDYDDDDDVPGNQPGRRPDHGRGNSQSNKRPINNGAQGQENTWQPSSSSLTNKDRQGHQRQGRTCRGLPGSPFAVPGIDSWCAVNCGRGYCPLTHCLCD